MQDTKRAHEEDGYRLIDNNVSMMQTARYNGLIIRLNMANGTYTVSNGRFTSVKAEEPLRTILWTFIDAGGFAGLTLQEYLDKI